MGLPYLALPTAKGREKKDATNPVRKVERDGAAEPVAVGRVGGAPAAPRGTPCSGHRHVLREEPPLPVTGTSAQNAAAAAGFFCSPGSFCTKRAGQFWELWPCVRAPRCRPEPLPVNHPGGACLPQRESRRGVSGGFGIHGASLGSPEPRAASPLPRGTEKEEEKGFLGCA